MGELEITTLLPLDRWAQIVGLDPRHFRQVTTTYKPNTTCSQVWKEHPWQESDAISRDDVVIAVHQAEEEFAEYLGFKVLPDWISGERHKTPQVADKTLYNKMAMDPQGFNLSLPLRWGHFIEGGAKTQTLISANVDVAYSDLDADGYAETATITFATTTTDPQQLAVFYAGKLGAANWEIKPFRTATISALGVAIMTFWKHQFVEEAFIEALDPTDVNGDVNGNFLDHVDVYRRWTDPTDMCYLIWDPQAGSCSTECCDQTTQNACLVPRDYEQSVVGYQPGDYSAVTADWTAAQLDLSRNPDQIHVCYFAGYRDMRRTYPVLQMDPEFERAIVYYSLTLLNREVCSCSNIEGLKKHWTTDLALRTPGGTQYATSNKVLDNPLGTTRAAVNAWNLISRRLLARAVDY